jgi:hypothetical protein
MWVVRSFTIDKIGKRVATAIKFLLKQPVTIALSPVVFLMLFMLCHYPPNTYDSMTYHMARVAHWIQNQSIGYYITNISRQNEMGPGAEYIILFFQILNGNDYLANAVQFFCYIFLLVSLFYLLRVLKSPRSYHGSIILLTMTAPMFLFQATTTQNDLVAALVAVAIIISSVRILTGNIRNLSHGDFFLLGVTFAAGFLVKPTSVLVAVPVVGFISVIKIGEFHINRQAIFHGLVIALITFCVIVTPDIYRKMVAEVDRGEVYKVHTGWTKYRLLNPIKMTFQHVPWPEKIESGYRKIGIDRQLYSNTFRLHNDYVGNPLQLLFVVLGSGVALLALPIVATRNKRYLFIVLLSLAPILSWVAFGLMVRDNPWVSRVQLPLFAMLPFSLLFVARFFYSFQPARLLFRFLLVIFSGVSLTFGFFALANSEHRSLAAKDFFSFPTAREARHYSIKKSDLRDEHQGVLMALKKVGCTRLGLLIGPDDYDYPLTWNLMENNIQTRHIKDNDADDWSCMLYVTNQEEVPKLAGGTKWINIESTYLWQRDITAGFEESTAVCENMSSPALLPQISSRNNAHVDHGKNTRIAVLGNDPQVLLPPMVCPSGRSVVLKIIIDSPISTEAKLYYKVHQRRDYSEDRKWTQLLSPGMNTRYFFIPHDLVRGRLRLDFETESGVFIIHHLEIRPLGSAP